MIELIAARGNTSLESAVSLTKTLRWEIQSLGLRLNKAVGEERLARQGNVKSKSRAENDYELKQIVNEIKKLLDRIEDAVPMINLAITTSGVNLSTTLPTTVSPSRLLQASTFLTAGDSEYCMSLPPAQQIGPAFTLSLYMLFSGHAYRPHDSDAIRETTWKEVIHKARVKLLRVPLDQVYDYPSPVGFGHNATTTTEDTEAATLPRIPSEGKASEFAYQLLVIEDLDDDRVHTFDEQDLKPGSYEGVQLAGIREIVPIHEISKIFYADTGKILNIGTEGETNNPILLLKRDPNATPPRRMMEHNIVEDQYDSDESRTASNPDDDETQEVDEEQAALDEQLRRESSINVSEEPPPPQETQKPWRLPPNLDPEWLAFEVYVEEPSSESDIDDELESEFLESNPPTPSIDSRNPDSPSMINDINNLHISSSPSPNKQIIPSPQKSSQPALKYNSPKPPTIPAIRTSLSLLEMLIRLTALQQFQQSSHLAIPDELLTFFLSESATVGAGADPELRRRARREARLRVGFDPYDESPIKRRGEEYLEHEFHPGTNEHVEFGGEDGSSPGYDYNGYPHGRSPYNRSRSNTPIRSSPAGLGIASPDYPIPSRERGHLYQNISSASASPLLRRATAQPGQKGMRQPLFRNPPTAPPTSSSPRAGREPQSPAPVHAGRGRVTPDTPPSTGRKGT